MSAAVPIMALTAALIAGTHKASDEETFAIFFSVIAAGNAYLFAMAIGEFSRSVIAIPIGAAAGFVAVQIFSYAAANLTFLILLCIFVFGSMLSRNTSMAPGCLLLVLVFLGVNAVMNVSRKEPSLSALGGYPFVCMTIAASMPLERSFSGVFRAGISGGCAALYGMLFGGLAGIVGGVILSSLFSGGLSRRGEMISVVALLGLSAMVTNYFCVKGIFTAVHRADVPRENQADSEAELDSEAYVEAEDLSGEAAEATEK